MTGKVVPPEVKKTFLETLTPRLHLATAVPEITTCQPPFRKCRISGKSQR
jgi:hypothetical protein